MKMENKEKKTEMISELKEDMVDHMLEGFTENYEYWKSRMELINSIISHVDEEAELFAYNDFCVKAMEVVKHTMDTVVDFDSLFLSEKEAKDIEAKYPDNQEEMEAEMLVELNKKYEENLQIIINKKIMTETVKTKLGDKFGLIEQELEDSFNLASVQLNEVLNEKDITN